MWIRARVLGTARGWGGVTGQLCHPAAHSASASCWGCQRHKPVPCLKGSGNSLQVKTTQWASFLSMTLCWDPETSLLSSITQPWGWVFPRRHFPILFHLSSVIIAGSSNIDCACQPSGMSVCRRVRACVLELRYHNWVNVHTSASSHPATFLGFRVKTQINFPRQNNRFQNLGQNHIIAAYTRDTQSSYIKPILSPNFRC